MTTPKLGDIKQCTQCGEEKARYHRISSDEARDAEELRNRDREEPGDRYAWSCEACGFSDRVPS